MRFKIRALAVEWANSPVLKAFPVWALQAVQVDPFSVGSRAGNRVLGRIPKGLSGRFFTGAQPENSSDAAGA